MGLGDRTKRGNVVSDLLKAGQFQPQDQTSEPHQPEQVLCPQGSIAAIISPQKPGRGRPKKEVQPQDEWTTKAVRLHFSDAERLRKYCFDQRTNIADVMREAVSKFLKSKGY